MDNRPNRFYFDWWNIRKTTIYLIASGFLILLLSGGAIWAWRAGYFQAKREEANAPKDAARIVSFEGDVRVVQASTRETILVTRATYVSAGDTIQTQADGKASVQMIDGSTLNVRPNSTVVIRDNASIFGGTNVRVSLDTGALNVKTQDQNEQTKNVVEMNELENAINAQTEASFNNNGETGGEIRISRGSVESNTGGEKALIQEGEYATVANGRISAREKLLAAPKPVAPSASEQIPAGADISFRWLKPESSSALQYHLQVSKAQSFAPDAIVQERTGLNGQIFGLSNVAPGIYYWRLRTSSASGQSSDWGEFTKFTVTKNAGSEQLAATEWQVERIGGSIYQIRARTQAGTNARAAGRETFADASGAFSLQVSSGASNITVELSDERGNRARYNLSLATGNASRVN